MDEMTPIYQKKDLPSGQFHHVQAGVAGTKGVVVDGKQSSLIDVVSGVPQGTVLGPLLFLLHTNDLPSVVSSKVRLFADDWLIYRNIKNKED